MATMTTRDGTWLRAIAPLRDDVLAGDYRFLYLLWLIAVEGEEIEPDTAEPLPGLGPLTDGLKAIMDFFQIDVDLVAAAAERPFPLGPITPDDARAVIAALDETPRSGC